jgi:hypothetical protein
LDDSIIFKAPTFGTKIARFDQNVMDSYKYVPSLSHETRSQSYGFWIYNYNARAVVG